MAGILGDRTASAQNARAYDLYGSRPVDVVVATNPATEAEKKVWLAVALLAKERAAFDVEKAEARLDDATAEYERVQALTVAPQLVLRNQQDAKPAFREMNGTQHTASCAAVQSFGQVHCDCGAQPN